MRHQDLQQEHVLLPLPGIQHVKGGSHEWSEIVSATQFLNHVIYIHPCWRYAEQLSLKL